MARKCNIPIRDILYHGTVDCFNTVDLSKCKPYKDFGRGFYLAYSKMHSVKLVERNMRRKEVFKGYLYKYEVNTSVFKQLVAQGKVLYFAEADLDWLDFILLNRETNGVGHNYDIVIGPTADDDTKYILNSYKEGVYGDVGSLNAMRTALTLLRPERLGTQLAINTHSGLGVLHQSTRLEEVVHK